MGAAAVDVVTGQAQRSVEELAGEIRAGAVRLAAATAAWLGLVAEFDRARRGSTCGSPARWAACR
jgi:hypothetical protein